MAEFEISEQDRQLLETVRKSINMGDISERDLDSFMNFMNEESRPFRELRRNLRF